MSESFWTTFFATLPATLAAVGALIVAVITALKTNQAAKDIRKVEIATNSMKDALVAVTGAEAFARGANEERQRADHRADQAAGLPVAAMPPLVTPVIASIKSLEKAVGEVPVKVVKEIKDQGAL